MAVGFSLMRCVYAKDENTVLYPRLLFWNPTHRTSFRLTPVTICITGHGHGGHGDAPDVIHHEELKYDHDERLERHSSARRIQNIVRSSSARKVIEKKRSSRNLMPAQDEHGHANPSTIRLFTSTPLVHIHHHGKSSRSSSVCSICNP